MQPKGLRKLGERREVVTRVGQVVKAKARAFACLQ
jgi:hypothetical protein